MTYLNPKAVDVPAQNSADNNFMQDVVGNKTDTIAGDSIFAKALQVTREATEAENHLHNRERWGGLAAIPSGETHRADFDVMTPFQIDAGNDTWGSWLQVLGSNDTPIIAGMTEFDLHRIIITNVENVNSITRIQIAYGATGAGAFAAGDYACIMLAPASNTSPHAPIFLKFKRQVDGTKVWVRCWVDGKNTSTVDFFIGIHEYDINP